MARGSSPPDLPNNMAAVTAANAARTCSAHQADACQVQVTLITGIIYTVETQGGKVALPRAVEARFRPLVPCMPFISSRSTVFLCSEKNMLKEH